MWPRTYSIQRIKAAEKLFELVIRNPNKQGTYTTDDACGEEARQYYNSSGYLDEIVWGGTWLFFATGNVSYLKYATDNFPNTFTIGVLRSHGIINNTLVQKEIDGYTQRIQILMFLGSIVGGLDQDDHFLDSRDKPEYTELSISGNAGLVAALIALHDPPKHSFVLKGFQWRNRSNGYLFQYQNRIAGF
ncbi:hypothetical protein MKX01_034532 [Papaver californicum]|nr:hypothetical protein MKX01_034532 [Papaver californicum]